MKRNALLLTLAGALLAAAPPVRAEPEEPGKGVARISLIHGDVSVRRGDSGDWVAAVINAPLLADDRVLTGAASRAEVQFDYYHRIRLASDTEIRLTQLEYRLYQIQVVRGTVTFSALKGGDAQVELTTPAAALRPVAWGEYRITVFDDERAELTVRRGEAEIYTPSGSHRLRPGRTMVARLDDSNRTEIRYVAEIPRDRWDEFNQARDRELSRAARVYQYVSRDIYGAEDLDGHGTWIYVAPYGWCWQPFVAVGWAPYRLGRWVWLDWYGWTWVSYDPWGWAPYHYGRWFWWNNAWLWYPGPVIGVRHWWSPALVGWFGWSSWGGFTAGVGFGWGAVGWVPLAPFEPLYPWWGRRFAGYRSVNYVYQNTTIIHNTNIVNVYRNARVRDGITVVRGDDFVRGQVGRPLRLGGEELARASVARGALPFAPARESLRWADREPAVRRASLDFGRSERFFSRMPAARSERVPFDEQRRTLEQWTSRSAEGAGRRESFAERNGLPAGAPGAATREAERNAVRSREQYGTGDDRGWRRADENPRRTEAGRVETGEGIRTRTEARTEEGSRSGPGWRRADEPARPAGTRSGESEWRRFGDPGVGLRTQDGARTRTADTERIVPRSEERSDGAGRGSTGWRTFGDPARSPVRSVEGEPSRGTPRSESPRWSTGGGSPRTEAPAYEAPRTGSPRWSTGGGRSEAGDVRISPSPRSEPTRTEPARGGEERRVSPRGQRGNQFSPMSRGGWSTGGVTAGGASGWTSSAADSSVSVWPRSAEGGAGVVDLSLRRSTGGADSWRAPEIRSTPRTGLPASPPPMTRGGWSTGGGAGQGDGTPAVISPRATGGDAGSWRDSGGRSSWSTGGGIVDVSPRGLPRSEPRSPAGGWSTGSAGGRTGWAADGFRGGSPAAPAISVPRSAPSMGGFSGGARGGIGTGGGMSSMPGFGGGVRGGGGIGSAPSMGGGGIRGGGFSGGGFSGGGAVRSAPSGGGGMRGGRGR